MKKQIYNLFTIENGIILDFPTIAYINDKVSTNEELMSLLSSFKSRYNTSSIAIEQVDSILCHKIELKNFYNINSFKFAQRDLCKELETFRNKFTVQTTPISLLEEHPIEDSVVFGVVYKNKKGSFSIEDDYDTIELDLGKVENNSFIFDGMFIGARGIKQDSFVVKEFVLVEPVISKKQNRFLVDLQPKICVFHLPNEHIEDTLVSISSVLLVESPDLTIIFAKSSLNIKPLQEHCENVIVIPTVEDPDFIPCKPFEAGKASNPFVLETYDKLVGFINVDLFKNRQEGLFFNTVPMKSFIKSVLSQSSLYPFGNCDFSVPELPNLLVILQDFHPLVMDVDSVTIISIPSKKEACYAVLDFSKKAYEVRLFSA